MLKKCIALFFAVFFFAAASTYALDFIKLGTGHDTDFWGTPDSIIVPFPSTVEYLAERGKFQTNPISTLDVSDQNVADALAGVYGPFDALLFSESINSLSEETYLAIRNYASQGGCVVVTGSHNREDEFLNSAFGYSITLIESNNLDPINIQPEANGTVFENGPVLLLAADQTNVYNNTPGRTIYSGADGVAVFTDQFGEGVVTAIGWDYCCEPPDQPEPILAWFEVANRAFDTCLPPEPRSVPTLSEWGLMAMAGVLGIIGLLAVRRKVTA